MLMVSSSSSSQASVSDPSDDKMQRIYKRHISVAQCMALWHAQCAGSLVANFSANQQ
jgi:hypothetical protein